MGHGSVQICFVAQNLRDNEKQVNSKRASCYYCTYLLSTLALTEATIYHLYLYVYHLTFQCDTYGSPFPAQEVCHDREKNKKLYLVKLLR